MSSDERPRLFELFLLALASLFLLLVCYERWVFVPSERALSYRKELELLVGNNHKGETDLVLERENQKTFELSVARVREALRTVIPESRPDQVFALVRDQAERAAVRILRLSLQPLREESKALAPFEVRVHLSGPYGRAASFLEDLEARWEKETGYPMSFEEVSMDRGKAGSVEVEFRARVVLRREEGP